MAVNDRVEKLIEGASKLMDEADLLALYDMLGRYDDIDRNILLRRLARKLGRAKTFVVADMLAHQQKSAIQRIEAEMGDAFELYLEMIESKPEAKVTDYNSDYRKGFRDAFELAMIAEHGNRSEGKR